MSGLAALVAPAQDLLWLYGLVFLRIGAMMFLLPAFGESSVPARVKLGCAAAFCLIVTPAVAGTLPAAPGPLPRIVLQGTAEIITGLAFGIYLRLFIFALQIAGSIAAQSTSLSQIFGGSAGVDPQPAIGHILVIAGLALAALMGLHVAFAQYMIQSYTLVPFGSFMSPATVAEMGVDGVSRLFALGFTLSAPFVIASLLYNVILGVINKAMPQLMVSFVGAPAITAGGLLILCFAAPIMLGVWIEAFSRFVMSPGAGF